MNELNIPDIEALTELSGLPESIMASDMINELERELMRMGKPEKDANAATRKLVEAFAREREQVVQACYMAGYLKGMADMAQRTKRMLESRGESETRIGEARKKVA